jgi:hypothetical protein
LVNDTYLRELADFFLKYTDRTHPYAKWDDSSWYVQNYGKPNWHCVSKPHDKPLSADHFVRMFKGESFGVGTYFLDKNSFGQRLVIDLDGHFKPGATEEETKKNKEDAARRAEVERHFLQTYLNRGGVRYALEKSKGGNGWHFEFFFAEPISGAMMRRFAEGLIYKANLPTTTEIYPPTDELRGHGKQVGRPGCKRWMDATGGSCYYDPDTLKPIPFEQWLDYLKSDKVEKFTAARLVELGAAMGIDVNAPPPKKLPTSSSELAKYMRGDGSAYAGKGWSVETLSHFFSTHNIAVDTRRSGQHGSDPLWTHRFVLVECPTRGNHSNDDASGAAVMLNETTGRVGFKCNHNGCRDTGWKQVRAVIDPSGKYRIANGSRAQLAREQKIAAREFYLSQLDPVEGVNSAAPEAPRPSTGPASVFDEDGDEWIPFSDCGDDERNPFDDNSTVLPPNHVAHLTPIAPPVFTTFEQEQAFVDAILGTDGPPPIDVAPMTPAELAVAYGAAELARSSEPGFDAQAICREYDVENGRFRGLPEGHRQLAGDFARQGQKTDSEAMKRLRKFLLAAARCGRYIKHESCDYGHPINSHSALPCGRERFCPACVQMDAMRKAEHIAENWPDRAQVATIPLAPADFKRVKAIRDDFQTFYTQTARPRNVVGHTSMILVFDHRNMVLAKRAAERYGGTFCEMSKYQIAGLVFKMLMSIQQAFQKALDEIIETGASLALLADFPWVKEKGFRVTSSGRAVEKTYSWHNYEEERQKRTAETELANGCRIHECPHKFQDKMGNWRICSHPKRVRVIDQRTGIIVYNQKGPLQPHKLENGIRRSGTEQISYHRWLSTLQPVTAIP